MLPCFCIKIMKKIFKHFRKNGLKAVYTMHTIDGFAFSLIGIFIPIYLLNIGFSVREVILYYVVQNTALLISSFLAGSLGSRIGVQRVLLMRFPFLFTFLILLNLLDSFNINLYLIAAIDGLQAALYWIPLHIIFAENTKKEEMGSSIGKLFALPQLVSMFGPLLGGITAMLFGFKFLFGLSIVILLIAVIPILNTRSIKTSFRFRFSKGIRLFKKYPKYFFAEIFDNIAEETEGVIWPIFVYLSLINITSVGIVGSLLALSSAVFTFVLGKRADKAGKRKLIKFGALLMICVWLLRFTISNEWAFYVLTIMAGFFMMLFLIPYQSILYKLAKEDRIDEFFVFREVPVYIGRMLVFAVALFFVTKLEIGFVFAALSYIFFFFI